jgi:hypothetical protein
MKTNIDLKYYLYVSDAKVDMMFSQIPQHLLSGIAQEMKVNLGFLSATAKRVATEHTRYQKLKVVLNYLWRNASVGTVDEPASFIHGVHLVRWGRFGDTEEAEGQLVYFAGATPFTYFGLGGSMRHVLGAIGTSQPTAHSQTPELLTVLCRELGLPKPTAMRDCDIDGLSGRQLIAAAIEKAALRTVGPEQKVEFLAKTLITDSTDPDGEMGFDILEKYASRFRDQLQLKKRLEKNTRRVLLATPIYVAIAERQLSETNNGGIEYKKT